MSSNRAKILTDQQLDHVLTHVAAKSKDPLRDYVIILLSFKAGLRACEIAGLRPTDILDAGSQLADVLVVPDSIAKNGKGRTIPMHPALKRALAAYLASRTWTLRGNLIRGLPSIADRQGAPFVTPNAIQLYLSRIYAACGLNGVTSHSGRRTFLTRAAQKAGSVGCSLKDVQRLAGHSSITTTEIYVEPSEQQAKLVGML
jgi:integrase